MADLMHHLGAALVPAGVETSRVLKVALEGGQALCHRGCAHTLAAQAWPRGAGEEAQKQGGTLIIRAEPGRALELQYEASRIVARINSFFGYGAIAGIKVMQGQARLPQSAKPPPVPEKPVCEQELASLEDSPLKAALERLGRSVAAVSRSSPQGK